MSDGKVLNLDELFGEDRPVVVRWREREYALLRFTAMGVKQVLKFQRLRRDAVREQLLADESEEAAAKVEALFDAMLAMIGPELPLNELPYVLKPSILAFYFEQLEEKKTNARSPMTGEKSIQP